MALVALLKAATFGLWFVTTQTSLPINKCWKWLQVLHVLALALARIQHIVYVAECAWQALCDYVQKLLKCLARVVQAKQHQEIFKCAKWSGNSCLPHIRLADRDLVLRLYQIDLAEP